MNYQLFIDADTALEFSSRAKAFIYADNYLKTNGWMLLTTGYNNGRASVFNPYLKDDRLVEYFETEQDALRYISSFLT